MECCNPGGSGKDRAAQYMLSALRKDPRYRKAIDIVEGTSGSTGISLALQCRAMGCNLTVVMPDDQSQDKVNLLGNKRKLD